MLPDFLLSRAAIARLSSSILAFILSISSSLTNFGPLKIKYFQNLCRRRQRDGRMGHEIRTPTKARICICNLYLEVGLCTIIGVNLLSQYIKKFVHNFMNTLCTFSQQFFEPTQLTSFSRKSIKLSELFLKNKG